MFHWELGFVDKFELVSEELVVTISTVESNKMKSESGKAYQRTRKSVTQFVLQSFIS